MVQRGGTTAACPGFHGSSQRPGETELVTIRIGEVEEALAPRGITRGRVGMVAGRDHARVQGVDVGMIEDDASPPRPGSLGWLGDEIEITPPGTKAREGGGGAAVGRLQIPAGNRSVPRAAYRGWQA